jgi:hypothetical protein
MATALRLRRGTTTQHNSFTGAEGEITVDTTKDTVVVHDGSTVGGFPLAKATNTTIAVANGSASTPGLTTSGDLNTGLFFPAADTIAFSEGGTESGRFSSDGYFGLGITGPTCKLDVVGGIKTSRTGVTSPAATDGNIFSGTYTPTLTNTTNITASTAYECQYIRVGSVVTVSGMVDVDITTGGGGGAFVLGMSIPIASNFSAKQNLGGTFIEQVDQAAGVIYADITNDRALFAAKSPGTTNLSWSFTFTYRII